MTLILTVLTREYAMQASDRRLSDPRTGGLVSNHANKAIVWGGAVIFAFTGLAAIGGERADIWLASALRDANTLEEALACVCKGAEKHPDIARRPLAVVGAGVIHESGHAEVAPRIWPTICWAGNCIDERGAPRKVDRGWARGGLRLPPRSEPFLLHVAGQQLYDDELGALRTNLAVTIAGAKAPATTAELLRDTIRKVADDRTTKERKSRARTVGKGILVSCLPYGAIGPLPIGSQHAPSVFLPADPTLACGFEVGPNRVMLGSEPRLYAPTFMYVPPDVDLGYFRGPTWTWPRGWVLTDFVGRAGGGLIPVPGPAEYEVSMKVAALTKTHEHGGAGGRRKPTGS